MNKRGPAMLAVLAAVIGLGGAGGLNYQPMEVAVLQGLDKVTARISTLEVPVGGRIAFGSLQVAVQACYKTPPEERPESAAFLEIGDLRPGAPTPEPVFSGWMFASSPSLSALEHPVYDLWVLDCRPAPTPAASDPDPRPQ